MYPLSRVSRLATLAVLALFALPSCTDQPTFNEPPARALYTTPTGLVTANPPAIVAGAGDISSCSNNNDEATAKLLDAIPGTVITMGDNVMPNGTTAQFASCYDPTWGRHKGRTRPAAGNHDYNTSGAAGYFAYFGTAAGEPGKGYYSYELGAWHVIVLNSNISSGVGSAQDIWLKADLAAHPHQCILSYYHHPLYSSATGSGTGGTIYSGVRNLFTDLYAGHADLVLNGHRHVYERIAPMKPDGTADPVGGVREIISGTGGDGGGTLTNIFPLSEVLNGRTFGVVKLYLYDDSYTWKFVPIAGKTFTDSGSTACHSAGGGNGGGTGAFALAFTTVPSNTQANAPITPGVVVEIRDQFGNRVSSAADIAMTIGTNPASGTLAGTVTRTAVGGVATFSDLAIDNMGTGYTLVASATGLAKATSPPFNITPPAPSAARSTVVAGTPAFTAGGSSVVTVTVKDGLGNPLSGVTVSLSSSVGGDAVTQPAAATSPTGEASGSVRATIAGSRTITAVAGGITLGQQPSLTVSAGPPDAARSTVSAAPSSIVANTGMSTVTVTVRDTFGNPVSGTTVVVSATGSGNEIFGPSGTTAATGVATATLRSSVAEVKTISATANGLEITQKAAVAVTPPNSAATITHTLLTSGANPTNLNSYTTASIAPGAHQLVTVAVLDHRTPAAISPTLSGGGMTTWTLVASVDFDTIGGALRRLSVFRAMSPAPGSGPITIKFTNSVSNVEWIVSQWDGVDTTGVNGSGAIAQTGSNATNGSNGLAVTLASFGNANDVAYGAFGVNKNALAITPGAGYARIDEQPSGENTPGDLLTEWTVNLTTVNATWSNLRGGALGLELKAATGP